MLDEEESGNSLFFDQIGDKNFLEPAVQDLKDIMYIDVAVARRPGQDLLRVEVAQGCGVFAIPPSTATGR